MKKRIILCLCLAVFIESVFSVLVPTTAKAEVDNGFLQVNIKRGGHYSRYFWENITSKTSTVRSDKNKTPVTLNYRNSNFLRKQLKEIYKKKSHNPKFCPNTHLVLLFSKKKKKFACLDSKSKLGNLATDFAATLTFTDLIIRRPAKVKTKKGN